MSEYTGPIHDDRGKKICCRHCGSENVSRDAIARWSVTDQRWEISDVLDNADCDDCGGETSLDEVLA